MTGDPGKDRPTNNANHSEEEEISEESSKKISEETEGTQEKEED